MKYIATARYTPAVSRSAERAYTGFAQLSPASQAKVIAYVQAQLPPDAEIVAGATVKLHSFILMVDASITGLSQITDYSLRQFGSGAIPGGTAREPGGQVLHYDTLITHPQFKSNAN